MDKPRMVPRSLLGQWVGYDAVHKGKNRRRGREGRNGRKKIQFDFLNVES